MIARIVAVTFLVTCISAEAFAADAAKGKELYKTYCVSCHGETGLGDGPTGKNLPPAMKPRNFQVGDFKVVTDDASLIDLLKKGGPAFGLSPLMAAQAALSDDDIKNVVAFVRSLKK